VKEILVQNADALQAVEPCGRNVCSMLVCFDAGDEWRSDS